MKTITFYSYKGGVGRSLALSNIAIRLSELGKKVCVLDFDLEAPGLQFKFDNYSKSKPIEKGIVDYIDEFNTKGAAPKNIEDYSVKLFPANEIFKEIVLIPAGNIDSSSYWKKLSCINWSKMFYEEGSNGVKFFLDLKHKIETELEPEILLIDSRTGITDIAGITLKLLADEAVILAANNKENIYGSKKIIKSLTDEESSLFGKIPKVIFILTRLPYTDTPRDKEKENSIVKRRTIEFKNELSIPDFEILVIHSDRRLEENERPLIGDDYEAKSVSISNDYLKLFDKLTNDVLTQEEILIFRNKKNAEKEFISGLHEVDNAKKILHFSKAIEFDNTQFEYYIQIGNVFKILQDFANAESNYLQALQLKPDSAEALDNISLLFFKGGFFDKALSYIEKSIKTESNNWYPYNLKAWIYKRRQEYDKAISILNEALQYITLGVEYLLNSRADLWRLTKQYEKAYEDIFSAIEIDPDSPVFFGTLAEIYAADGKLSEFYLNLNIALSKGVTANELNSAKDVYEKLVDDDKFISLMNKYSIDINDILKDEEDIS